jgi:hypothetical protein
MKVLVHDEGGLPGLDEILAEHVGDSLDDAAMSRVEETLARPEYPVEVTMGLGSALRGIIDRLRGRRILRELPEEVHPVTWLELHVPKNGTASLTSSQGVSAENAVEFALFGSGIGSGRKVKLTFEESSDERQDCVQYLVRVRVKPVIYQVKSEETAVLNVTGVEGEAIEPFPVCPYCGIDLARIDLFEHRKDPSLDLRKETVEHHRTYTIESVKDLNMKIGVKIPSLQGSKLSLSAKLSCTMSWKIKYGFKPGLLYQPYWRINGIPPHTPMWAIEV